MIAVLTEVKRFGDDHYCHDQLFVFVTKKLKILVGLGSGHYLWTGWGLKRNYFSSLKTVYPTIYCW